MPVLGITGGVACGKSSFVDALLSFLPDSQVFSADAVVSQLVEHDPEVRNGVLNLLGTGAFSVDGTYNRPFVRERIFAEPALRAGLDSVFHPRVRALWSRLAEQANRSGRWLFAEIPLLFETGGESLCDRVVTVACSPELQWHRLTVLRGLSGTTASQIRVAQTSLEEKMERADHLIWNDFSFPCLQRQAGLCAAWISRAYPSHGSPAPSRPGSGSKP
jgi:dephospho-CoA kinase